MPYSDWLKPLAGDVKLCSPEEDVGRSRHTASHLTVGF